MYELLLFVHVGAVLAFMLAHGAHVTVMWRFHGEADPERALTFFNTTPRTTLVRVLLAVIVVTGVANGIMQEWFGDGWIWASLVILAAVAEAMRRWGGGYYGLVSAAAERAIADRTAGIDPATWQADYDAARGSPHTVAVSLIGAVGLAVILWLMMFKPF